MFLRRVTVVNEGQAYPATVLVEGERIARIILPDEEASSGLGAASRAQEVDGSGCYLLPGVIDEHVHLRDPGLTQKADIATESRAAAAGGVTTVMDMPNTLPPTTTLEALEAKLSALARHCRVNYSAYLGATNTNADLLGRVDRHRTCGVKVFMGSSTGGMLVDRREALRRIFGSTDLLIAAHCEDQGLISAQVKAFQALHRQAPDDPAPDDLPLALHPLIRSAEACYRSSALAVQLAQEAGARLHLLHLSTARELSLLTPGPLDRKRITAEACLAHLLFTDADYSRLGTRLKCNPAVKTRADRDALRRALHDGRIDTVATDHAPHLLADKQGGALRAASGMPMVQFSLVSMLGLVDRDVLTLPELVEKMCHAPARLYGIRGRGYLRPGYQADMVLVRPLQHPWTLTAEHVLSRCGWSPLEGQTFRWRVEKTWVNGRLAYVDGAVSDDCRGQEIFLN